MTALINESELIVKITNGDREAFTILYKAYCNNLYRYIYLICKSKELSDEIVQVVFIKMWSQREKLKGINSFRSYVYRSAKNLLLDDIKRRNIEEKVLLITQPATEESVEKADTRIIFNQYSKILQEAIDLLPEKRKRIVEMRTKEELSLDEIAEKLGISKSVVKKQLYTGMSTVREYIQHHIEYTALLVLLLDCL